MPSPRGRPVPPTRGGGSAGFSALTPPATVLLSRAAHWGRLSPHARRRALPPCRRFRLRLVGFRLPTRSQAGTLRACLCLACVSGELPGICGCWTTHGYVISLTLFPCHCSSLLPSIPSPGCAPMLWKYWPPPAGGGRRGEARRWPRCLSPPRAHRLRGRASSEPRVGTRSCSSRCAGNLEAAALPPPFLTAVSLFSHPQSAFSCAFVVSRRPSLSGGGR
jgi:hypothetical protein